VGANEIDKTGRKDSRLEFEKRGSSVPIASFEWGGVFRAFNAIRKNALNLQLHFSRRLMQLCVDGVECDCCDWRHLFIALRFVLD
jgi:hypothetical protein